MGSWYAVSYLGWLITTIYTTLTAFVLHGLWTFDSSSIEIEFFRAGANMYLVLLFILLCARYKRAEIFKSKNAKHSKKK